MIELPPPLPKLSRRHIRTTVRDLQIGEHGIINQFSVLVLPNRHLYVKADAELHGVWGRNERRPSHHHGALLVTRLDEKRYSALMSPGFATHVASEYEREDLANMIAMNEIEYLGPNEVPCERCDGRGYHVKKTEETDEESF